MTMPDNATTETAEAKVSHIGLVPARGLHYDGEDLYDWVKAVWTTVALMGAVAGIPLAVTFGMTAPTALQVYVLVNVAGVFAWLFAIDAGATNLLYGRKTPGASYAATGARRAMSVGIQVALTIAALEMLALAGLVATGRLPAHKVAPAAETPLAKARSAN